MYSLHPDPNIYKDFDKYFLKTEPALKAFISRVKYEKGEIYYLGLKKLQTIKCLNSE